MSVSQKGVLTVIGVTTLALALIFFTEKTATAETKSIDHSAKITKMTSKVLDSKVQLGFLKALNKPLLAPPPIGPFQVARPNSYNSLGKAKAKAPPAVPTMKQSAPKNITFPNQNIKAPANRIAKPQAPVQNVPKLLTAPPVAPIMPHYRNFPMPVQMYQQVPPPIVGGNITTSSTGAWQNNPSKVYKHIPQPTLQSDKQQEKK